MKNICLFTMLGILLISALNVSAEVQFKFTVIKQGFDFHFSSKTNVHSAATTTVISSSSKTTNYVIDNAKLLQMLANSFNTQFSTNAAFEMDTFSDRISVTDGPNIILDVSPVLSVEATNVSIDSSSEVSSETLTGNQDNLRMRGSFMTTSLVTLIYDDSAFPTRDGHTTRFSITGLETKRGAFSVGRNTARSSSDVEFTGAGQGTVFDGLFFTEPFVVTGKFSNVFHPGR